MRRILSVLLLALLGLAACSSEGDSASLAESLPLDAHTPTLIFFYTDG